MVVTLGQQYNNVGEKPTVVLSTCALHTNSVWEREAHINWSMVTGQGSTRSELP